jgi:hypothetical protein
MYKRYRASLLALYHKWNAIALVSTKEIDLKRQTKHNQKFLLFHSVRFIVRSSNLKMRSWPNSRLLVLLPSVDPSVLFEHEDAPLQEGVTRVTPLHDLAALADPFDCSTHEHQLILAKNSLLSTAPTTLYRTWAERFCTIHATGIMGPTSTLSSSHWMKVRIKGLLGVDTVDVYHSGCSREGQIPSGLACHEC